MSKQQPSSFEATASILERLFQPAHSTAREPASNAAVIFAAIIQTRAIDRLTKAVEANTAALGNPGVKNPNNGSR